MKQHCPPNAVVSRHHVETVEPREVLAKNNAKLGQRGRVVKGSRDLLLEFLEPLYISGTVEARDFIFGTRIDYEGF